MKDFILILIMSTGFTAFVSGLLYAHYLEIQEKIEQAYKKGYEDGRKDKE